MLQIIVYHDLLNASQVRGVIGLFRLWYPRCSVLVVFRN